MWSSVTWVSLGTAISWIKSAIWTLMNSYKLRSSWRSRLRIMLPIVKPIKRIYARKWKTSTTGQKSTKARILISRSRMALSTSTKSARRESSNRPVGGTIGKWTVIWIRSCEIVCTGHMISIRRLSREVWPAIWVCKLGARINWWKKWKSVAKISIDLCF